MTLSVAFFGSGRFAVPIVEALRARGVLRLLVTQDVAQKSIAFWREVVGDDVFLSSALDEKLSRRLRSEGCGGGMDAIVTASYGLCLTEEILQSARLGCYNVHASLLPRWRGASPIQHAILHGDAESGVSVIRMNERIDRGAVVLSKRTALQADEVYDALEERLSRLAAAAVSELIERLAGGEPLDTAQDETQACWARRLRRADGLLNWRAPAVQLERRVRAFSRWPGSFFLVRGERIVVHSARLVEQSLDRDVVAGTLLCTQPYPLVACGDADEGRSGTRGALALMRLQRAGRKVLDAADFLRGFPLPTGVILQE